MADPADPAALARLRSRTEWASDDEVGPTGRRAECQAARSGHLGVVTVPGEVPRCEHCGATLSPDALRRAGIKGRRA